MQAVILAAGRGSRMGELTDVTPKPLLQVGGKTLFEYELSILPESIDEVIVIVGYLGGAIQKRFGGEYGNKRILYVEQEKLDGTAGALWRAKDLLKGRFLVLMSDDIYAKDDAARILERDDWALVVQELDDMKSGGNVEIDAEQNILAVKEGNHSGPGRIGTNMFALDTRIFECDLVPKSPGNDEYGLPQTALAAAHKLGIAYKAVPATFWIQITDPTDLAKAEEILGARA
ncbi:MAG: NTP transferase domain-containing protein [Candidatus Kaiserbacteria bacterium]|nr:NTP transferase domain-containing protein [Candidatus Kaiserbacteria bacterium]